MICTNCSQQVPDTANVCGYCGQRLKVEAVDAQQLPNLQFGEPSPEIKKSVFRDASSLGVQQRLTWFFVLFWAGIYVVGHASRRFIASLIGDIIGFNFYNLQMNWQLVMEYIMAGLIVGLLQWLILRKKVGVSISWIVLTGVGLLIGNYLYFITSYNGFLIGVLSGVIYSFGQWVLLRKLTPEGYWWIVINVAAQLITQTSFVLFINIANSFFGLLYNITNILFGLITGIGILWLLRNILETPFSTSRKNINRGL